MHQRNEYFNGQGELTQSREWSYSSLSRSVLFFENGAFSQGSTQYGPFGEFGAELGFIAGDRRLRAVILYDSGQLKTLTLIQEEREGQPQPPIPPLTPEQLEGTWQGTATTLYADLRPPVQAKTQLEITFDGQHLHQSLHYGQQKITSSGAWDGEHLTFPQKPQIKLFCLPGGGSAVLPVQVPTRQRFFLELGWLVTPELRLRLSRHYDATGAWEDLTLAEETKVAPLL
jgi:hypothetical protein